MLREPVMVTTGYDRPNLYLEVQHPKNKYVSLRTFLEAHPNQVFLDYNTDNRELDPVTRQIVSERDRSGCEK